jgi:hypothetical protein
MTQISHDAGQLRKPDGAWQVTDAESVLFVPKPTRDVAYHHSYSV